MADFDFGTIIYLIAIVVATIYGGSKKRKKQRNYQDEPVQAPPKKDYLADLLREFEIQIPSQQEPQIKVAPEQTTRKTQPVFVNPAPETIEAYNHYLDKVDDDYFERRKDYFESNKIGMNYDAIMEGGINSHTLGSARQITYKKTSGKINLKKAVLYSEILNRKQW